MLFIFGNRQTGLILPGMMQSYPINKVRYEGYKVDKMSALYRGDGKRESSLSSS